MTKSKTIQTKSADKSAIRGAMTIRRAIIISCMYGALFGHMNSLGFFSSRSSSKGVSRAGNSVNLLDTMGMHTQHIDSDMLYKVEIYPFGTRDVIKKLANNKTQSYKIDGSDNTEYYMSNSQEWFVYERKYLDSRSEEMKVEPTKAESTLAEQAEKVTSEQKAAEQSVILFKNSLDSESSLSTFFSEDFKSVVPGAAYESVSSAELFYQAHKGCYDEKELRQKWPNYNWSYIKKILKLDTEQAVDFAFNKYGRDDSAKLQWWTGYNQLSIRWHSLVWKYNNKNSQSYRELMETGDALLFAGIGINTGENDMYYNDSYWTIGPDGNGSNILGKLLMLMRASLRKQQKIETEYDLDILKGNFTEFNTIADKLQASSKQDNK